MKRWLISMPTGPEWVFSSPALRTLQTAELISTYFNSELIVDNNLYLATADALIDRIVEQSDAQAAGRSVSELEEERDANLVAMLKALRQEDTAAGAFLNRLGAASA